MDAHRPGAGCLGGVALSLQTRVVRSFQTLANLLAAMREDDFSIRGRTADLDDPLGAVMVEVNALGRDLARAAPRCGRGHRPAAHRHGARSMSRCSRSTGPPPAAGQPHRRAADEPRRRAAARAHRRRARHGGVRDGDAPRVVEIALPGGTGALGGPPHGVPPGRTAARPAGALGRQPAAARAGAPGLATAHSRARPRARQLPRADQVDRRLPRRAGAARRRCPTTGSDDMQRGLPVIGSRAEALSRFTTAYARLARLPAPRFAPVALKRIVRRVAGLETRVPVGVHARPRRRRSASTPISSSSC